MNRKKRILLVDDEPVVLAVSAKMLAHLGYDVDTHSDGMGALSSFDRDPGRVDLLITDLWMPRITGHELAGKLAAIRPELPIIFCSGYGESDGSSTRGPADVRAVLMKPIRLKELEAAVRNVLEEGPVSGPAHTTAGLPQPPWR